MPKSYYLVPEAAKILGVSERTVWNYLKNGKLKKHRKPGDVTTWIEALSLYKCAIWKKRPSVYGCRDYMIEYFREKHKRFQETREVLREVGMVVTDLDNLSCFKVSDEDLDRIIEKYTEYWNKYDIAAYMGESLSTVKRLIRWGKLKPVKEAVNGWKLFSNLDVMDLYRELHTVQIHEDNSCLYELCAFLEEHPECVALLEGIMD